MSEEEEERAGHKNPRRPDKVTHAHVQGFSHRQGAHMLAPVALKAYLRVIVSFKKTRAQLGMRLGESCGVTVLNGIAHR